MNALLAPFGRDILLRLDPERAHGLAIRLMRAGLATGSQPKPDKRLAVKVAGLAFANPIGMAAGFDKNAEVSAALLGLGFGFVEVGTVTPKPQAGNDRPRIFRLAEHAAAINRLGFNNKGHDAALARLKERSQRAGIVGANIGANKDSADRISDYGAGVKAFAPVADYLAINISSPNTPGLRNLQSGDDLDRLLTAIMSARGSSSNVTGKAVPVFLKIAPDLDESGLDAVAEAAIAHGLDGLIVSNTTLSRQGVETHRHADEAGGLSGAPLFNRSTVALAKVRRKIGPDMALIGVGGVSSADDAMAKIEAGADLVQLYTGFIYKGPSVARDIVAGLAAMLDRDGETSIAAYRDRKMDDWADRSLSG